MPEGPSALPPDDPCAGMVATYQDYVGTRIDAFMQADRYQKFREHYEPLQQCCTELRPKLESLRPANPNLDALRTIRIPTAVYNPQSECANHPYFLAGAGGAFLGRFLV